MTPDPEPRDRLDGAPALLDEGGLLRHDDRWVAIPDAQLPVVSLLLDRFGMLVRNDEIAAAYVGGGGSANPESLRTVIARVRERVRSVGLQLHVVRRRGVVLDVRLDGEVPRAG